MIYGIHQFWWLLHIRHFISLFTPSIVETHWLGEICSPCNRTTLPGHLFHSVYQHRPDKAHSEISWIKESVAIFLAPEEKKHPRIINLFERPSSENLTPIIGIGDLFIGFAFRKSILKCLHCILHPFQTLITRWWFQIFFIFIPTWGRKSQFDTYFSKGLVQPPTRLGQWANWGNLQAKLWQNCNFPRPESNFHRPWSLTYGETPEKSLIDTKIPNLENHDFQVPCQTVGV